MGVKMDAVNALHGSGKQVGEEDLKNIGCSPTCLTAAKTYGLSWVTLLTLFQKYGPQLEAFLLDLFSIQPTPTPAP